MTLVQILIRRWPVAPEGKEVAVAVVGVAVGADAAEGAVAAMVVVEVGGQVAAAQAVVGQCSSTRC
jgi:hypothetical protein